MAKNYYSLSGREFSPNIQRKINNFFTKIEIIYPEKIVVYLKRDYPYIVSVGRSLRKELGYKDSTEFFNDFGFHYINVNDLESYIEPTVEEIQQVMERINNGKKVFVEEIKQKYESETSKLLPISEFYYKGSWHAEKNKVLIDEILQKEIDYTFDKLLELYPNRIVFNINDLHRKFVSNHLIPLKYKLKYNDIKDLIEAYGFIFVGKNYSTVFSTRSLSNDNDYGDILINEGNWQSNSNKRISKPVQRKINYILDIALALYPDRRIFGLTELLKFEYFDEYLQYVCKQLIYKDTTVFFKDFGFKLEIDKTDEKFIMPDVIYSPDKKIVYKILTTKLKIPLDANVLVIKKFALNESNIKILDFSRISDRSLIIEDYAICNCLQLKKILNPTAIRKINKLSFQNVPCLDIESIRKNFLSTYNLKMKCYELEIIDENDEKIEVLSNRIFSLGSYIKDIKRDSVYFVNDIKYPSSYKSLELPIIIDYCLIENDMYRNSLMFDYDKVIELNSKFKAEDDFEDDLIEHYFDYLSNKEPLYVYDSSSVIEDSYEQLEEIAIPIFQNGNFIKYRYVNKKEIFNEENKKIIVANRINKTIFNPIAILGINEKRPFMKYKNFIYDECYIKTFLKIHNVDASIFFNSSLLSRDKKFVQLIFKLFPYTDKNLILVELKSSIKIELKRGEQNEIDF